MALTTAPDSIGAFTADAFAEMMSTPTDAPAWWQERRHREYERFTQLPLPNRKDEAWRFSNLRGLQLDGFAPARAIRNAPSVPAPFGSPALAFLNGQLQEGAQPSADLPPGLVIGSLLDAARDHPELLKEHFMAQSQRLGSDKFAALHAAFIANGAFIFVPKGMVVPRPIVIQHVAAGVGAAVFPHTLIITEDNARVAVVESFQSILEAGHSALDPASPVPAHQFACGANDIYAGHGAQVTYIGAQDWSRDTLSLQMNSTVVGRDARVQLLNLHVGGHQARHESMSQLRAPGAFSEMLALTVADDTREFDQRTLQIHQAPNTKSDLLYKNALRDKARTIFSGLIVVDPDAQKTDAYQSNRNLMLSDDAEANSLPGLEIQANDVRCTHGATSSRIDPEQEFYLQSRGISKPVADELLTFGFFEEVLNRLENDELHESLRGLIRTQFQK